MRYEITLNGKTYEVEVVDNRALVGAIQDAIEPTTTGEIPRVVQVMSGPAQAQRPVVRRVVRSGAPAPGRATPPTGAVPVPVAPQPVPQPAPQASAPAATRGEPLSAPMPGLIKEIRVQPGQAVKSGQVLMILEAMKMENEIVAPYDATVTAVVVNSGQTVSAGAPLLMLTK